MPPVFTAFLTLGSLDILLFLMLPYALARGRLSPWGESPRLAFMGVAVATGLLFGLLSAITADRRDHSAWWFLAGHLGTWLAPILALAGLVETRPVMARLAVAVVGALGAMLTILAVRRERPGCPAYGTLTRRLCRLFHACGNIWLGISLLAILVSFLIQGTRMEDAFGHKAAQALIYANWPFGLLYMAFAISLISATLRKYPWRVDQTGWIVVHTALVTIIIGTFMTFWGKQEGMLSLREGETASSFQLSTETRLQISEVRRRGERTTYSPVWEAPSNFDLDPSNISPHRRYEVKLGKLVLPLTVEHYYARATPKQTYLDNAPKPRAAVVGQLIMPGSGASEDFGLVEGAAPTNIQNMLRLEVMRAFSPAQREALLATDQQRDPPLLRVRDKQGKEILRLPLDISARHGRQGTPIAFEKTLPGTKISLVGRTWYDNLRLQGKGLVDASPGYASNPALEVLFKGPEGTSRRYVFAWAEERMNQALARGPYKDWNLQVDFAAVPRGALWFVPGQGEEDLDWVFHSRLGSYRSGRVVKGQPLDLGIPMKIVVERSFSHFNMQESWTFDGYEEQNPVIMIRPPKQAQSSSQEWWLPLNDGQGVLFSIKGRQAGDEIKTYAIRWLKSIVPLGFSLHLHDFHRDFYPGSDQPRTFESYLRLQDRRSRDPRLVEGADIKIDMNHPLRYRGWRFFQARFSSGQSETTFLEVNRDPGRNVTWFACALLALGLVIVFFQKRFLRALGKSLKRNQARAGTKLAFSAAVVAAAFLSCLPGVLMISFMGEGPKLILGVLAIILLLIAESLLLNTYLTRKLEGTLKTLSSGDKLRGA